MLEARPVRNSAARVTRDSDGAVRLAVKRQRPRYLVPPLTWVVPIKPERLLALDAVGTRVWDLCDGQRTVERVVDAVAPEYGLTFHEARVAVTAYLKQLLQRGAIAMAHDDGD